MAFNGSQKFTVPRAIINKDGVNIESITDNKTLTKSSSTYQRLSNSSGGQLDVILPDHDVNGMIFWIANQGNNTTKVKNATGTEIASLPSGTGCMVVTDGVTGWRKFFRSKEL